MSQNISIVPVKHSFLMYDMQKEKIDRLAGKIILKFKYVGLRSVRDFFFRTIHTRSQERVA